MPVSYIESSKEGVKIHYHLRKPWNVPDEHDFIDIRYDLIGDLNPLPKEFPNSGIPVNRDISRVNIDLPDRNIEVALVFERYSERAAEAEEEFVGIFLAE